MRELKATLDVDSLDKLYEDLMQYAKSLDDKCELLIKRLAEENVGHSKMIIFNADTYDREGVGVDVGDIFIDGQEKTIAVKLTGDKALFMEFGSGITYNTSAGSSLHPKAGTYTIDSYNPEGKANIKGWDGSNATNPKGWYTSYGRHTYGTPTYAPLYQGFTYMRTRVVEIAKEVFGT